MHFTHLHVHTEYSLLDGSNKISEYVDRVKELGMDSAAITDHGVMYGVIDFYKAARAAGINPILGCEVYVAPGSRFDRETGKGASEDRYYHLVLLAENNQGYENLTKIVSAGFVDGYYYRPRVDKEILEKYHEGIIALSACLAGEVSKNLLRGFYEEAKEAALEYRRIFGENNFFLELQDHGLPEQRQINPLLMRLHEETGIELVCTNDVHYTQAEDAAAHDILLCIQTGKKLADEDRMRYEGGQYYVKTAEEMAQLFYYAPQALENTWKIAQRCHVEIEFGVTKLPKFDVPDGLTALEYLHKLCYEGLERLYSPVTEELKERLAYELGVIEHMGYVDYFLIVWDFIHYARSQDIMVGPGRGSAAGSLVSYCLGITKLDPMRYSLLFERFLNPERVSMPDIDVDFGFERRSEVIDYVVRKYGKEKVAQIVTFGTLAARGVIRDVGRVMDLPYALCDTISKMVPQELNITLDKALTMNPELKKLYDTDEQIRHLIDMSRKLEGLPRHTSMHAAGVVICQKAVDEYVPLSRASDGTLTTQFTMTALEELGLLKMDFLGLRTLTVIQNACRMAEESNYRKTGIREVIDMDAIDYDDKAVYASLGTGKTDGVFQLESAGMKSFMKELRPASMEDVIAGISLYRPGPMDFIPQYIRGKNNPDSITYETPLLEPILEPTYGCIVYQEQVMQIVRDLGGYSLGRSDLVRRAMSKKKAAVMQKERQNFVYGNAEEGVPGCQAKGISEATANKIFDEMTDFARYAFNKSHAAAYAVVAYQTAWLKYYYPVEFMAALMTSVIDNPGKVAEYIMTCRQMKIEILPPDINEGVAGFSVRDGKILYGLSALKSIGRPVIDAIIREREKGGRFTDLSNFADRLSGREVNKRTVESFIKAGAFDGFGATRRQLMMVYAQVMDQAAKNRKNAMTGQMSLFDLMGDEEKASYTMTLPRVGEFDTEQLLMYEKEVLGIYVSGHPLQTLESVWRRNISAVSTEFAIDDELGAPRIQDESKQIIGGLVESRTVKYTKTNKMMAFVTIEDLVGTVEVVIFPKDYEKYNHLLTEDARVFISGRVSAEDDKPSKLICERVWPIEEPAHDLWIQFETKEAYQEAEKKLKTLIADSDGRDQIVIYVRNPKAIKRLGRSQSIRITPDLLRSMQEAFGEENVRVTEVQAP
ncbi:MAG: DNA polymerase III subunit alpha [Lachnospiraceae bacterium]|nr:DNA polymerase III subunit alpha [Lachnospiraceae bacterium]